MDKKIVGIVSDTLGYDPFHPRTFSGASANFFNALKRHGALHRAFGVRTTTFARYLYLLKNFYPVRATWRARFSADTSRRNLLTEEIRKKLTVEDYRHHIFQLGSYYDAPAVVDGRAPCFSYHDANFAMRMKSRYAQKMRLSTRQIEKLLAYERKVNAGMTKVFTFSEYLRKIFIREYGLDPATVVTIGTGVNVASIPDPLAQKKYDNQTLLFVGIEFERKGGWQLLEAFAAVRSRFQKATLHIVGPRSLEIPPKWRGGVQFHGYLNKKIPSENEKLQQLTKNSCLFVLPSLYEPMGNAALEGMVNQLPAVVTNDWGFPEMVVPGKTGELVECGSVADLEAKLCALLVDPDRLREMGDNARAHVLKTFTWDRVCERLIPALNTGSPEVGVPLAAAN